MLTNLKFAILFGVEHISWTVFFAIPREGNDTTDWLAKKALGSGCQLLILDFPHFDLLPLLSADTRGAFLEQDHRVTPIKVNIGVKMTSCPLCKADIEVPNLPVDSSSLLPLHSRANLRPARGNLCTPPLPFGRPTSHRNCLPEIVPWPVGPDTRLEF
ncbi:hypothetical protein V6N13_143458 [Hibiscus sabdariffa]